MNKEVIIDYLYLDLQTCDRCIGTDKVLEEVISELTPALESVSAGALVFDELRLIHPRFHLVRFKAGMPGDPLQVGAVVSPVTDGDENGLRGGKSRRLHRLRQGGDKTLYLFVVTPPGVHIDRQRPVGGNRLHQ